MDGPALVIGPGAIGTLFAARLAAAGRPVAVACRDAEAARRIAGSGVVAEGPGDARAEAPVRTVARPARLLPPPGLVILATRCGDAEAALTRWLPFIPEEAPVVAVQNGVLGDALRPLAGARLVECTVAIPATRAAPGHTRQTGPGALHVGPWPQAGPRDDPAWFRAVARELAPVATVHASSNMRGVKWTKLLVNSCITSLGALTGWELGRLLADRRARDAFLRIAREGHAAGRADGVRFETVAGFRPGLVASGLPGVGALLALQGRRYARQRSSSLQSLERGGRTEVDHLNGRIAATGSRHGVPTPVNGRVVDLVHAVERGDCAPGPELLDRLA